MRSCCRGRTGDAPRRIQRPLMLGTVRDRGVIPHGVRSDIPLEGFLEEIYSLAFSLSMRTHLRQSVQ